MNHQRLIKFLTWLPLSLVVISIQAPCQAAEPSFEQNMQSGQQAMTAKQFAQAEKTFARAAVQAQAWGEKNYRLPMALDHQAEAWVEQFKYDQAEVLYRRVIAIKKKTSGPDSLDCAEETFKLGRIVAAQSNKFDEGMGLMNAALSVKEKQLGKESLDVIRNVNYLADLYWIHHKYNLATPLYKRARIAWDKQLGPGNDNSTRCTEQLKKIEGHNR